MCAESKDCCDFPLYDTIYRDKYGVCKTPDVPCDKCRCQFWMMQKKDFENNNCNDCRRNFWMQEVD